MPFTDKQDLKLIRAVKDNPLLYDKRNFLYMDFNEREVVWQKIGDLLRCPASACKARWVNIRDINRRILLKNKQDSNKKGSYKYSGELSFMKKFYRIANDNLVNNDGVSDCELPSDSEGPSTPEPYKIKEKKVRLNIVDQKPSVANNINDGNITDQEISEQVDSFLLSIGNTLKTFTPFHLNIAKTEIFAIVQEHELQQIVKE